MQHSSSITVQKSEFVIWGSYFCRFVDFLTLPCAGDTLNEFEAIITLELRFHVKFAFPACKSGHKFVSHTWLSL